MKGIPTVEFKIQALGEQFAGMVAMHSDEIRGAIEHGFERAREQIADEIVRQASDAAKEAFIAEVKNYFAWGPGRDCIRAAVGQALEPVAAVLRGDSK